MHLRPEGRKAEDALRRDGEGLQADNIAQTAGRLDFAGRIMVVTPPCRLESISRAGSGVASIAGDGMDMAVDQAGDERVDERRRTLGVEIPRVRSPSGRSAATVSASGSDQRRKA
jgi:hypothetical protein